VKSETASVSTGIFAVQVSLVQRLQLSSSGVAATKVVLLNCVNIKSKPQRYAGTRNRQGVDVKPSVEASRSWGWRAPIFTSGIRGGH